MKEEIIENLHQDRRCDSWQWQNEKLK